MPFTGNRKPSRGPQFRSNDIQDDSPSKLVHYFIFNNAATQSPGLGIFKFI